MVDISDSPACIKGQQLVYEVAKLSSVSVSCTMDANPDSEIQFNWQFNTTGHTVNIPVGYYQGRVKKNIVNISNGVISN